MLTLRLIAMISMVNPNNFVFDLLKENTFTCIQFRW